MSIFHPGHPCKLCDTHVSFFAEYCKDCDPFRDRAAEARALARDRLAKALLRWRRACEAYRARPEYDPAADDELKAAEDELLGTTQDVGAIL